MSKLLDEVATNVATQDTYIPNQTVKSIVEQYNWDRIKTVIADENDPKILAHYLGRCIIRYVKYMLADPDLPDDDYEPLLHIDILDSLHVAIMEMDKKEEEV